MKLDKIQTAAYELIQSDTRFLYTLVNTGQKASRINSNYINDVPTIHRSLC